MFNQELLSETLETTNLECWENERTATPVRAFAVRLHATGCSLRETKEILRLFGVKRSHQAVFQWVHRLADSVSDPPSARTARPQHHEADPQEKAEFQETVEKTTRTKRENRRCRRSIHKARRKRPAACLVPDRFEPDDRNCNVLEVGDSFFCWTEENLTRFHGIRLLEALTDKFGEELVVFLDRAGYFYAKDLWEHVSGERETETVSDSSVSCVRGDDH